MVVCGIWNECVWRLCGIFGDFARYVTFVWCLEQLYGVWK